MTIQHGLMQDCLAKLQDGAGPAPRDLGPVHEHTAYPMYVYILYKSQKVASEFSMLQHNYRGYWGVSPGPPPQKKRVMGSIPAGGPLTEAKILRPRNSDHHNPDET